MISIKKLIKMARKWQKFAAMQRKRISLPRKHEQDTNVDGYSSSSSSSSVVEKGHFVIYSVDGRRFVIPLVYLSNDFFRQLLEMSEEEFGISGDGPITLPCDGAFMDYIISLIQKGISGDLQEALLTSLANAHCCSSSVMHQERRNQQLLVY